LSGIEKPYSREMNGWNFVEYAIAYNMKYLISGDSLWHECLPVNFSENLAAYVASPIERQ
jgi:hypothetical protein